MDACQAADDGVVLDLRMTRDADVVDEDCVIAYVAVMAYVDVRHEEVAVADRGEAAVLRGADVDGAEFAQRVVVADLDREVLA